MKKEDFLERMLNDKTFKQTLDMLSEEERLVAVQRATSLAETIANSFVPLFENINDDVINELKKVLVNK